MTIQLRWLRKTSVMKTTMGQKLIGAQKRYKKDFYKRVTHQPDIIARQEFFIERPPQVTSVSYHGDKLAGRTCSKVLKKSSDPFNVLEVSPDTVLIDEDGVTNRMS